MIHLLRKKLSKMKTYALLPVLPQGMVAEVCVQWARRSCLQLWEAVCCQSLQKYSILKVN